MLQWFNKQVHFSNSDKKDNSDNSLLSTSALEDNDYEFLFNQLLDGVAHGWHLGRIIKFFNSLEHHTTMPQWISWLKAFENRIVYSTDPSQRRVGAIMMRLGELTQSHGELQELGGIAQSIGKKLFVGNVQELIWEYDGHDVVIGEETQPAAATLVTEVTTEPEQTSSTSEEDIINQTLEAELNDLLESIKEPEQISSTPEEDIINQTFEAELNDLLESITEQISSTPKEDIKQTQPESTPEPEPIAGWTEQPTLSPDFVPEPEPIAASESNIDSLAELTEQLTVLQDATCEEETISLEEVPSITEWTEQPTVSPDFVPEPEPIAASESNIDSLAELTEQLTVLQEDLSETELKSDLDSESTLIAPNPQKTSLSVASFLEAAKALVPEQNQNKITPLTWEEFIAVLEQDEILAQQVAQHLQISSTNPQDIVQATVDRFNKKEKSPISPANMELVESWFNLGLKQASAEDFQNAIASWDKALNLNPNLSEAWHNRGSALGRLGKYEEAIQSFNKAINLAPERYQAWNDRAHALYHIKKWEQAVESWDHAISIMSDNYQFWYNRGCALEQLQLFAESISSYEKSLEIKPDFQPARSRYISLVKENSSLPPN